MSVSRLLPIRLAVWRPRSGSASGFTLLELLVVMGLLAMLMGIGVGFLRRRGSDFDIALATLRDQLRAARLAATTRHLPTEVLVEPGDLDTLTRLRARVLVPVAQWHMEQDSRLDDDPGLDSRLSGDLEPGRFGYARRPDADAGTPVLSVATEGVGFFQLGDGFAFRVDVKLDEFDAMTVMRLGSGLELTLDRQLRPRAKMTQTDGGGTSAGIVSVASEVPLPLDVWQTLELVHDGRELFLRVEGAVVDRTPCTLPVLQSAGDKLIVSGDDRPIYGLVDSVALWAYSADRVQELPRGVELGLDPPGPIRFDRDGDPIADVAIGVRLGERLEVFRVGPGGVLE